MKEILAANYNTLNKEFHEIKLAQLYEVNKESENFKDLLNKEKEKALEIEEVVKKYKN